VILWDGMDDLRHPMASGVYYYELKTETGGRTRKAVLVK